MLSMTKQVLEQVAPKFHGHRQKSQREIIDAVSQTISDVADDFNITTLLRRAHFLAQICAESDGFCTMHEYATGKEYEGRADLGNTQAGDGVRYKGRGLIQLTGRANYREFGKLLGLPLEGQPEIATQAGVAVKIACEFWDRKHLNHFADHDDIIHVTRRINGGLNGLDQRRAYLARAKSALNAEQPSKLWAGPDAPLPMSPAGTALA